MTIDFTEITLPALQEWLREKGEPPFRAGQIFEWIYSKGVRQWEKMTNLSGDLRDLLQKSFRLNALELASPPHETPDGKVVKFTWKLIDNHRVESVLHLSAHRQELTVSTQVGCPGKCVFCASGKEGFVRNLRPAEIVEQLLHANQWLAGRNRPHIPVLNFAGMGEPLKNVKSVFKAIELLTDPKIGRLEEQAITLSTVGVVEGLKSLIQSNLKIGVTIGLHAPNESLRQKIVPYAKRNPIEELIALSTEYICRTDRILTFDYVLLGDFNDHPDHAFELAHLLPKRGAQLRLIPHNPVPKSAWKPPAKQAIKAFRSILFGAKVSHSLYEAHGASIGASLGQLGLLPL
jgi:23S rRNA (adenine2503-C2)-methyltransferase